MEEVGGAGQKVPDVEDWVLHLLKIINPAQSVREEVRPDQIFEFVECHDESGPALVTDVGPTYVELLQPQAVSDRPHSLVLPNSQSSIIVEIINKIYENFLRLSATRSLPFIKSTIFPIIFQLYKRTDRHKKCCQTESRTNINISLEC